MRAYYFVASILLITLGLFSTESRAPFEVLDGGDAIKCRRSSAGELDGYYFLDYAVDYNIGQDDQYLSSDHPAEDILDLLKRNQSKVLAASLEHFLNSAKKQLNSGPDFSSEEIWLPSALDDLHDENLYERLPIECKRLVVDRSQVNIQQAVVRSERGNGIVFKYDRRVLQDFRSKPSQLSFLLIHEWLWYHMNNSDFIRDVNKFLHRKDTHRLSSVAFNQAILRLGVNNDQLEWIMHIVNMAAIRANTQLSQISCASHLTPTSPEAYWILSHHDSIIFHLQGRVNWLRSDTSPNACITWVQNATAPRIKMNLCGDHLLDIDEVKKMLVSTLAESLGADKDFADRIADTYWQAGSESLCH